MKKKCILAALAIVMSFGAQAQMKLTSEKTTTHENLPDGTKKTTIDEKTYGCDTCKAKTAKKKSPPKVKTKPKIAPVASPSPEPAPAVVVEERHACLIVSVSAFPAVPKYGETSTLSCSFSGDCEKDIVVYGAIQAVDRVTRTATTLPFYGLAQSYTFVAFDKYTGMSSTMMLNITPEPKPKGGLWVWFNGHPVWAFVTGTVVSAAATGGILAACGVFTPKHSASSSSSGGSTTGTGGPGNVQTIWKHSGPQTATTSLQSYKSYQTTTGESVPYATF